SKRVLPKDLHQSRMFALDLDQQRKSTRIEHCLVHLDAVQNPMTCFHLSINWLNCTNHLIDELVHGWARMAERCGMRLVEAPRAQDTLTEDNHPFHSPIRISLELQPPSVESIFNEEWVSEFSLRRHRDRRARIVHRMAKCIPEYTFERELLEEQDFILDVEAEESYPPDNLLRREYTFERYAHKYTQYVHRSGTAFVQICGPGQFLWINNYLFTSHQNHLRPQPSTSNSTPLGPGIRPAVESHESTADHTPPQSYYPVRRCPELWPHQILRPMTTRRDPQRRMDIPDKYLMQIVDNLGSVPADFDSINAAVTRVAVSHATGGSGTPPGSSQAEPNPDSLRANFMEICRDKNSLEMFWQQTIDRYRNGWRNHAAGRVLARESSKNKPMVTDVFTEGLWQQK
ncbi:hypothetical protein GQ54DRAFT_251533, partial [Martensiomyces pterosporus]